MKFNVFAAAAELLLLADHAAAFRWEGGMKKGPPVLKANVQRMAMNGTNGWSTFDQLIDHSDPSKGTFKQRYWYGLEFWNGPGSPIIFTNPGEQTATGFNTTYFTDMRLPGLMAKETGAAGIIMEHRYWGESSPFDNLTADALQYLTLDNSIKDMTYFAEHVKLPFDKTGKSAPDKAPWVYTGGSYPGALAGWMANLEPGTFWAYYGTSGVVESIWDFWAYNSPIAEATPKNCSKDTIDVISYVDNILENADKSVKKDLKDMFKLGELEDADFAAAMQSAQQSWQGTDFTSGSKGGNAYYEFCNYLENVFPNTTAEVPGAEGVGRDKALKGWAKWFTEVELPGYCESFSPDFKGKYNIDCFKWLDPDNILYQDYTPANVANRQWMWFTCSEPFGWWQGGAPKDKPSLASRLVNVDYYVKQCELYFPDATFPVKKTVDDVNKWTGGWDVTNTTRLMYTNGEWDPWRDATVSSDLRPDGPLKSTRDLPVRVIPHGVHCSDLHGENWEANEGVKKVALEATENMKEWVQEFYDQ